MGKIVKMGLTSRIKGSVKLISDRNGFNCGICNKVFKYKRNIKKHQIKKHGIVMLNGNEKLNDNLYYTCDVCKKQFDEIKKLKIHKFKKHIEPQIKLSKIGITTPKTNKTTDAIDNLDPNLRYKCNICNKQFDKSMKLKLHTFKQHVEPRKKLLECSLNMKEKEEKIDPNELLQK